MYSCNRAKTKFTGKSLAVIPMYKYYIELLPHNEKFEITMPAVSAHNLIIGTPYLDLSGKTYVKNMARP